MGALFLNPTFTTRDNIRIVGLAQPFRRGGELDGPAVWRRFRPFVERIPNRVGAHTFGINEVVDMAAGDLVYAPAVEVSEFDDLPDGLFGKVLEGGRFAIFAFPLAGGDIGAEFRRAYDFIYARGRRKPVPPARPVRSRSLRRAFPPGDAERRSLNLGCRWRKQDCAPTCLARIGENLSVPSLTNSTKNKLATPANRRTSRGPGPVRKNRAGGTGPRIVASRRPGRHSRCYRILKRNRKRCSLVTTNY